MKYLLLLRKSSRGSSRLHRHLGCKEREGPLGLTYSPYPSCVQCLRTAQLHSQLCTRNCPQGVFSSPGCQQRSPPQALLGYGVAPTQGFLEPVWRAGNSRAAGTSIGDAKLATKPQSVTNIQLRAGLLSCPMQLTPSECHQMWQLLRLSTAHPTGKNRMALKTIFHPYTYV